MTPQEILKSAGFPEDILVIDFETYYDGEYSLKKMSTIEYVTDPRFEITGLGIYAEYNEASVTQFINPKDVVSYIDTLKDLSNYTIVGQNLMFDCLILSRHFDIIPKYTVDILNLARHEDSQRHNDLDNLCKYYKTSSLKGDTSQFKGLTYKQMSPGIRKRLEEYNLNDVKVEHELFNILLPKLSNPETELRTADHTLKMYLNPRLSFDFDLATKLIQEMQQELENTINKAPIYGDEPMPLEIKLKFIRSNKFAKMLQDTLPEGEKLATKLGKKGEIPALSKTDEQFQALLIHPKQEVRDLAAARLAAKSWPTHIQRVEGMVAQAKAWGNKISVPLCYHAAHTARWGGTEGINLQNLPGVGRAGSGTNPVLSKIRHLLIAPPGYALPIADLAQIEARVLAWFAGQEDLLKGFANGEDIYSEFATGLFGHPVRKANKSDAPDVAKTLTIQRGFGKDAILGCGYGMGATKFYTRCLANSDLKHYFDDGTYDFAFIEKLIKTYRTKYPLIPKFWNDIEKCFRWVTKYPNEVMSYYCNEPLQKHLTNSPPHLKNSLFTFWNEHGTVNVQLPSGRVLKYPHARIKKCDNSLMWEHGHLWGGSITENLDQAVSRDILTEAILRTEEAGIPVVLHAHDEEVGIVPEVEGEQALKKMIEIMCTNPSWATGLPINAEGKVTRKYEK